VSQRRDLKPPANPTVYNYAQFQSSIIIDFLSRAGNGELAVDMQRAKTEELSLHASD